MLPFGHVGLGLQTPAIRTVEGVSTPGVRVTSDPVSVMSHFIAIPLREVYAVLWRLGVVDIED